MLTRCKMQKTSDFGVAANNKRLQPALVKTRINIGRALNVVTQC